MLAENIQSDGLVLLKLLLLFGLVVLGTLFLLVEQLLFYK